MKSKPRVLLYTGSQAHNFYREVFACQEESARLIPGTRDLVEERSTRRDFSSRLRLLDRVTSISKACALDAAGHLHVPALKKRRVDPRGSDLIHSAQYLLRGSTPWVVDFEDVTTFVWYRRGLLDSELARNRLRDALAVPSCRRILPWTEASRASLLSVVNDHAVDQKIQVVYPSIRPRARPSFARDGPFRMLFIGTNFYQKGGVETLRAFELLREGYDVELTMISPVPDRFRAQYQCRTDVRFAFAVSDQEVDQTYRKSHVLVVPVHTDTLGWVFLEGFARGLPAISTRHFAVPELIEHGRTGFTIATDASYFDDRYLPRYTTPALRAQHPFTVKLRDPANAYVESLAKAIESLIRDRSLLEAMGTAAYDEVLAGRFSPDLRRETMRRVYLEALE